MRIEMMDIAPRTGPTALSFKIENARKLSGSKKALAAKTVWLIEDDSFPFNGPRISARSARARLVSERIILVLEKYQPKIRPNPKTK